MTALLSQLFAFSILAAGLGLAAVAGVLAWDDVKAREWEHKSARRWEDV